MSDREAGAGPGLPVASDRELAGKPSSSMTAFGFLHAPGDASVVTGIHLSLRVDGRDIQVYALEGETDAGILASDHVGFLATGDAFVDLVSSRHVLVEEFQNAVVSGGPSIKALLEDVATPPASPATR